MLTQTSVRPTTNVFYPSEDGEPLAETYVHLYAILTTLEVLKQYLAGQQATVLADQFLYYSQGLPSARVAPDVMVILDVAPGGRDNYKIWEEGQVPTVIFEMTSKGTEDHDRTFKKTLYQQLGVQEYWLFDPKGEWIPGQLEGYRLHREEYEPITDGRCQPLGLRIAAEGELISFWREDNGEKLLVPEKLAEALVNAEQQTEQERQRAEQERQRAEQAEQAIQQAIPRLLNLGLSMEQIVETLGLTAEQINASIQDRSTSIAPSTPESGV